MKIYLAAPYGWRLEMARYKFELLQDGHACTSRWVDGIHPYGTNPEEAQQDLYDVDKADTLVLFTDGESAGGRHVEFGYALARGKTLYLVGEAENLFHQLAAARFATWDQCRQALFLARWED